MCSPPFTAPSIHSGIAASAGRTRGKGRRGGEEHREEREEEGGEKMECRRRKVYRGR